MTLKQLFLVIPIAAIVACTSDDIAESAINLETKKEPEYKLDFSKPKDNIYGLMKLMGDISGKRTYYFQIGRIFSHEDGRLPIHLLNYTGLTIREIRPNGDDDYISRYGGWMLMRDPVTNEVIDEWVNPWDNDVKEVEHFVTEIGKQVFSTNGLKKPEKFDGDFTWFDREFLLQWSQIGDNVWAPYQQFSLYTDRKGNKRYENAIHTYKGSISELQDPSLTSVISTIASQSQSPYFSWMGADNPGHMILTSLGTKLKNIEDVPEYMLDDVTQRYPEVLNINFSWE